MHLSGRTGTVIPPVSESRKLLMINNVKTVLALLTAEKIGVEMNMDMDCLWTGFFMEQFR